MKKTTAVFCLVSLLTLVSCNSVTAPMPETSIWPNEVIGNRVDLELVMPEYFDGSMPLKVSITKTNAGPSYVAQFKNGELAKGKIAFWRRTPRTISDQGDIGLAFQVPSTWADALGANSTMRNAGILLIAKGRPDSLDGLSGFSVWPIGCHEIRATAPIKQLEESNIETLGDSIGESCDLSSFAIAREKVDNIIFDEATAFKYQIIKK